MRPKRKSLLRGILAIAVLALLIVGAVKLRALRIHQTDDIKNAEMPPWAVRVEPVSERLLTAAFPVLATALTSEEQTISSQIAGEILEMGPREGQSVKKGQLLARIDTREIDQQILAQEAKLAAVQADLVNKEDQYNRLKKVIDKGGASRAELDAARSAQLAARHTVVSLKRLIDGLKVRRGYAEVKAPSDGAISARLAEPGNICSPAHPLYRITVARGARIRVSLPQQIIEQLHPGSTLVLKRGDKQKSIALSRIFPSLDARALGSAEADLENPPYGVKSGARVAGEVILAERKKALVVPHEAVLAAVSDPAKGFVFKVQPVSGNDNSDGTHIIQRVPVTIDLNAADGIAVLGDLKPGDRVVVAHDAVLLKLHDGDPVNTIASGE